MSVAGRLVIASMHNVLSAPRFAALYDPAVTDMVAEMWTDTFFGISGWECVEFHVGEEDLDFYATFEKDFYGGACEWVMRVTAYTVTIMEYDGYRPGMAIWPSAFGECSECKLVHRRLVAMIFPEEVYHAFHMVYNLDRLMVCAAVTNYWLFTPHDPDEYIGFDYVREYSYPPDETW